ncbi:MAG: nucleotidyltransferase domain-containing protein [Verrucomicrobia bacterium]|nr:nucleotidyltransferase domain-containing protein [Verrucomicrobiota bacterium]
MTPTLTAPPPLDEIQSVVRAACEGGNVARVDLFGSVARGEAKPGSDVDIDQVWKTAQTDLHELIHALEQHFA